MTTASSIRSPWEKLSASTCSALVESGVVVRLASEVNADPIRAPMTTMEAARIRPQAATMRHGWRAEMRASRCVNEALAAAAWSLGRFAVCWDMGLLPLVGDGVPRPQRAGSVRGADGVPGRLSPLSCRGRAPVEGPGPGLCSHAERAETAG